MTDRLETARLDKVACLGVHHGYANAEHNYVVARHAGPVRGWRACLALA